MSRKIVDAAECEKVIDLLKTGRCKGCGGLIRERIISPADVDKLLFQRDRRGKLIGIICPRCAGFVRRMKRERYF
ncbi:MAG TPA: hypothetical protein VMW83_14520 [Spirochaetia bacterium]|nr:hypothetical protein [Spirochaetia bacterium]